MRYGAFLQIFREIRKGMEGKGGKWEFSFRHGLHGFHRDFSFLLCLCHPVVEGSHIMLFHALREMSRQARHDRDTLSKSVTNPCNPCLKITRLYNIIW